MPKPLTRAEVRVIDYIDTMARATNEQKAKWLETQMQKLLPPELFALGKSKKGNDRMKLARHLAVEKIRTIEDPPKTVGPDDSRSKLSLWHGDKLVSEFHIRLTGTKVEVMVKDFPP